MDKSPDPGKPLRVLIVEDEPADAQLTEAQLKKAGYPVSVEVLDSPEQFQTHLLSADYDLILADYNMRTWTALDALSILKQSAKDIPLVVVSGALGDVAAVECIKQGAADYVLKDHRERLPLAVDSALRDAQYRRESARLQEKIRRAKEEWELTFDAVPDVVFLLDEHSHITRANRAAAALAGADPAQLIGRYCYEVVHGLTEPHPDCPHQRLLQTGREERQDIHEPRLNKSFDVTTTPVHDAEGVLRGCVHVMRDITQRKQAEVALRESQSKLGLILESTAEAIYGLDLQGRCTFCNPACLHLLGYERPEELLDRNMHEQIHYSHPDGSPHPVETCPIFQAFIKGEGTHVEDDVLWKADGTSFHAEYWSYPQRREGLVVGAVVTFIDITERKRAEVALRESEEKFRGFFQGAAEGILAANIETKKFVYANPAMCRMLGYTEEELVPLGVSDIHPQQDLEWVVAEFMAQARGEKTLATALPCLRKDGTTIYADVNASWLEVDGKDCIVGFFTDITERKRAEEALRESEERFRAIFQAAEDSIFIKDRTLQYTFVNPAMERVLDRRASELIGLTEVDLFGPEGMDHLQQVDRRVLAGETIAEEYTKPAQGRPRTFHVAKVPMRDHAGKIIGLCGIARDITERKQAEVALRESEVRFRSLVENATVGIYRTTPDGRVLMANPALVQMLGYANFEALASRNLEQEGFEPGYSRAAFREQIERDGAKKGLEEAWTRRDGSVVFVRESARVIRGENGEALYYDGIVENITERQKLEQQLRQAQKMEAVGRLAGGVAHDFNNLLTIIIGYSELLLERFDPQDPARHSAEEIKAAGDRAASLTRQLLAFSRQQVLSPRILDLNQLVSNLEKMLRRLIGEDVHLATVLQPDLGRVKADPGQLEQVIMNLVVNARDAMPEGGKLTLETANVELDELYALSHVTVKPGTYVMLAVSDTGCGMDAAIQAQIFEPFFTTKEEVKGTGLGLAMVYGIIKQSGGYIWVYSEPGRGTTFKIYLPQVQEVAEPVAADRARPTPAVGSETILLIEDEAAVRSLVRGVLEGRGYTVLEASRAEEAMLFCQQHAGPIHLLLTDVVMPQMTGPALAEKLKALRPTMKVLYMSGYTDHAVFRNGALHAGMSFIQKPFTPESLAQKVRAILDRDESAKE